MLYLSVVIINDKNWSLKTIKPKVCILNNVLDNKVSVNFLSVLLKTSLILLLRGFPGGSDVEESACNAGDLGSIPGLGRFLWRREWQPTPVFLPGEFHGQRSLAGYIQFMWSQRVRYNWVTHTHTHTHTERAYSGNRTVYLLLTLIFFSFFELIFTCHEVSNLVKKR